MFEWVVTDAPDSGMVGTGRFDPARNTQRTARAALLVAAALPATFTVETSDGTALMRGKCSEPRNNVADFKHGEPIRMARTFYNDAARVVYKLGDAQMGIYF